MIEIKIHTQNILGQNVITTFRNPVSEKTDLIKDIADKLNVISKIENINPEAIIIETNVLDKDYKLLDVISSLLNDKAELKTRINELKEENIKLNHEFTGDHANKY